MGNKPNAPKQHTTLNSNELHFLQSSLSCVSQSKEESTFTTEQLENLFSFANDPGIDFSQSFCYSVAVVWKTIDKDFCFKSTLSFQQIQYYLEHACKLSPSTQQLSLLIAICDAEHANDILTGSIEISLSRETVHTIFMMALSCNSSVGDWTAENYAKQIYQFEVLVDAVFSCFEAESSISIYDFSTWVTKNIPILYKCLTDYLRHKCLGISKQGSPGIAAPLSLPLLDKPSHILTPDMVFALNLASCSNQPIWSRLYADWEDGLSFNRLSFHIISYEGPTILIIRDDQGNIFGFFAESPWQDHGNNFFGSASSFLFSIRPHFSIMRSLNRSNGNYMYLNRKSILHPPGIGCGGSTTDFRLWLNENLDKCIARDSCLTFERGSLRGNSSPSKSETASLEAMMGYEFRVFSLEVWGCGGQTALNAQSKHREDEQHIRDRMKQVDKKAFLDNSFDREFLFEKNFAHNSQRQGREGND